MAVLIVVTVQVTETITGNPIVRVGSEETLQNPGPFSPATGDLLASIIDRMADEVKDKSTEQARQSMNSQP